MNHYVNIIILDNLPFAAQFKATKPQTTQQNCNPSQSISNRMYPCTREELNHVFEFCFLIMYIVMFCLLLNYANYQVCFSLFFSVRARVCVVPSNGYTGFG